MKKLSFLALAMLAISLLPTPLAFAQGKKTGRAKAGNVEEQIKTLQAKTIEALLKSDANFFQKYYVDDILLIHGPGTVSTKAQEIGNFKSGALKYESYDLRDEKIRVYGDTVVVNTVVAAKGMINSKAFSGDFRVTWVWVKVKGNWKIVSRQITKIPPSQ